MYNKQSWRNLPDQTTPLSAARLNHLETQFDESKNYTDSSVTSLQEYVDTQDNATLNSAKQYADQVSGGLNPASFGVPDDGTSRADILFQEMLNQLPPGAIVESSSDQVYKFESHVVIDTPISLIGGTFLAVSGGSTFNISSDDVTLSGISFVGEGTSQGVSQEEKFIVSSGTPSSLIRRTLVERCTFKGSRYAFIWLDWASDFRIRDNYMDDAQYVGVMLISPKAGVVSDNTIRNLVQGGALVNSYGIAATDWDNDIPSRAEDVLIVGNYVDGVPNWEGIDTHGGRNIQVIGNTVRNCRTPIAITTGNVNRAVPPEDCIVVGNYVEKGSAPTETAGIVFNGKTGGSLPDRIASGTIGVNVVRGFSKDIILDLYDKEKTVVMSQSFDGSDRRSASPQPFREWGATSTVSVPSGSSGSSNNITFPPGYFTATPIVQVTKGASSGARHVPYVNDITAAGCKVGIYDPTGGTSPVSVPVNITATQYHPTGNGLPSP